MNTTAKGKSLGRKIYQGLQSIKIQHGTRKMAQIHRIIEEYRLRLLSIMNTTAKGKSLGRKIYQGLQSIKIQHGTRKMAQIHRIIEEYRLRLLSAYPDKTQRLPDECRVLQCRLNGEALKILFPADPRTCDCTAAGSVQVLPQKPRLMPADTLSRFYGVQTIR